MKINPRRLVGTTLVEVLVVVAIIALLGLIGGCGVNASNGEGEKVGQVVKLSKQGFMRDTWEAQLIRGGMTGGSGSLGMTPFDFTIEDTKLVEKVKEYMRNQIEVTIKYRIEGVYSLFRTESGGYFLVSIEPVEKPKS